MTESPEMLALQQSDATCLMHQEALNEALADLDLIDLTEMMLQNLCKDHRRLLDQFAYRYIRLQDDNRCYLPWVKILRQCRLLIVLTAWNKLDGCRLPRNGWNYTKYAMTSLMSILKRLGKGLPESSW